MVQFKIYSNAIFHLLFKLSYQDNRIFNKLILIRQSFRRITSLKSKQKLTMGCCHPTKTHIISNTIPHPFGIHPPSSLPTSLSPSKTVERPSLRHQVKLQNMQSSLSLTDHAMTQNVTIINGDHLKAQSEKYLSDTLKSHFFFHSISEVDRRRIIKEMHLCEIKPNSYVFKQNDIASAFFIIHEGSVQVEIGGNPQKTLARGNYFGELALLYASPRSASIKALEPTKCWCITRAIFKKTMEEIMQKNYGLAKSYISKLSLFGFLTEAQKDSVAYSMFILKYSDTEVIFKENDDANSFYIVTQGRVEIVNKNSPKTVLAPGDSFGQDSFRQNQVRLGRAVSSGDTICLSISGDAIKNTLGGQISSIVYYNISKWALKRSQYLSKLSNIEIEKLLSVYDYKEYKAKEKVLEANTTPNKIVIVLEGRINEHTAGSIIGEQFFKTYLIKPISKDYIKQDRGMVGQITFQDICRTSGKSLQQIISQPLTSCHDKRMEEAAPVQDFSHIKIENLNFIKKLGQGQFGKVYLVRDKTSNQNYAVKCIAKDQIIANKMEKIMVEERNILEVIEFSFLLKFYRSFKDEKFIYLVTEYINGSELFDVIREIGLLSKNIARFYLSSLILCVEYLHLKAIIYRDLKPENIMVERDGYLKLIDMGTAKELKQSNGFRTFTIIGTPHYMAPEVMLGKGYSFSVDVWAIGVIFYEFICGQLPFGEDLDDPFAVHSAITNNPIKYPSIMTDVKAKRVIDQLLTKTSESRLPKGYAALKSLNYFDGFDWEELYERKMKSSYLPKKSQLSERSYPDGMPFLTLMSKEKGKIKAPPPSKIPNWDQAF